MKTHGLLLLFLGMSGEVMAQNAAVPAPAPASTSLLPAPGTLKWDGITFTGSLRSRVEGFDWFQPAAGDNSYAYSGNILRLGLSKKLESWEWNAEFALPFLLSLPSNAT